jgi:hypothetical protein
MHSAGLWRYKQQKPLFDEMKIMKYCGTQTIVLKEHGSDPIWSGGAVSQILRRKVWKNSHL